MLEQHSTGRHGAVIKKGLKCAVDTKELRSTPLRLAAERTMPDFVKVLIN